MGGMHAIPVGDVLPEVVLLIGAIGILIFALFTPQRLQSWAAALAFATVVATAIVTIPLLSSTPRLTFADTYAVDAAALWAKFTVLAITALTVALSVNWFAADARHGEYYTLLLLSALGALLLAGAADLMQITLAALLSSATGFVLAAYHRRSRRAAEAAMKYYLLGAFANAAMVYGIAILFGLGATTTLAGLLTPLAAADSLVLVAATGLIVVGLAFKVGAVPAHAWMPDVAEGAPAPVAAFITAAPKVGGLVALARIVAVLPEDGVGWRPLVAVLAAATMTVGNLAALWQDDVRRLLGWSAVSQTGYGLMAIVALGRSDLALPSLLYFLIAYSLGNLAAFGVVVELRGQASRVRYAGRAFTHPFLIMALVVSFLSFIGIPPLAGFAAKLALFGAAIEADYAWLAVVAAVNTVVSVFYYARVLGPAFFEVADVEPLPRLGSWAAVAVGSSAGAVVWIGIWAEPLFGAFRNASVLPQ